MSAGERRRRSLGEVLARLPGALRGFNAERVLLRAAALTYLTIVSLVPLVAVVLFGLQTLQLVDLQAPVRAFLLEYLAVGVRENVLDDLEAVLEGAGRGIQGGVGVVLLLGAAFLLLRNIEKAFDDLWGIHAPRPLWRQLPRYVGLLLAGPVVLGLSLALTAALRAWAELHGVPGGRPLFSLVPLLLATLGLGVLYKIAPAAKVRWRAAFLAACLAAPVWELAKLLFGQYAAYAVRADFLYGPLVAIPLFLVWVYVSWLIVLFGGRLAFAVQHPAGLRLGSDDQALARALELCAARLAVALAAAQGAGAQAPRLHRLAVEIGFPEGMVRALLPQLEAAGLVTARGRRIELAAPAERLTLGQVVAAVRGNRRPVEADGDPDLRHLAGLLRRADQAAAASLHAWRLSELAGTAPSGPSREAGELPLA